MDCVFCKIVSGEAPSHIFWEDQNYVAFLSIFPNTQGVSVVIPKKHYPSNAFDLPDEILAGLILATKKVASILGKAFDDVGRTGLVLEGFGVDHVHAKLFPLHGTMQQEWKPISSAISTYYEKYPGYISSHDADRADDAALAELVQRLRRLS